MSDNTTGDSGPNNSSSNLTRRSLMALAGASGLGLASTGTATASSDYLQIDGGNAMTADLDVGGNNITNVSGISLEGHITPPESQNWSSYNTSGSGNGNVQIRDAHAGTFHLRATEGSAPDNTEETNGVPGEIVVQAPMRSANTNDPGVSEARPTSRFEIGADNLSVSEWRTIDVVQEPSIDHTADLGKQLLEYLRTATSNGEPVNHKFVVPDGTYTWNTPLDERKFTGDTEFTYLGVVGKGDVTFDVTDPNIYQENEGILFYINSGNCRELELADFDVDVSDEDSGIIDAGIVFTSVRHHANIRNITLEGQRHRRTSNKDKYRGHRYTVRVNTTTASGFSIIQDVRLPNGDTYYGDLEQDKHAIAFSSSEGHVGRNLWLGCYVEGFIDNGFYVKANPVNGNTGSNYVYHSRVKNCGNGGIRLGDGDHAECCEIVNYDADDRGYSYTGLWLAQGHCSASNINIDVKSSANNGVVRVRSESAYAENVKVESDAEHFILDAGGYGKGQAVMTNWRVIDKCKDTSAAAPICAVVRRNNVVIDGWDLDIETDVNDGKRYGFRIGDTEERDAHPYRPNDTVIKNCRVSHNRDDYNKALIQIGGTDRTKLLYNEFGGEWIYPASATGDYTADDCLVIGNRIDDDDKVDGDQKTWQGDFNFGYEV